MAKMVEELVVVKLSRLVKDADNASEVLDQQQRDVLHATVTSVIEDILEDKNIVVEIAELG
jgi:uncharacterized protein (UPF0147 family)